MIRSPPRFTPFRYASLFRSSGDDSIVGNGGDDTLSGGSGNDTILAGAGNDLVYGGAGDDTILNLVGPDTVYRESRRDYHHQDHTTGAFLLVLCRIQTILRSD